MEDKITIIERTTTDIRGGKRRLGAGLEREQPADQRGADTPAHVQRTRAAGALPPRRRHQSSIHLEYRGTDGLESQAPILAARTVEVDDGQVLLLWVRQEIDEEQLAAGLGDDEEEDDELPGEP